MSSSPVELGKASPNLFVLWHLVNIYLREPSQADGKNGVEAFIHLR